MASKSLEEVLTIAVLYSPMFRIKQTFRNEMRDFLSHEVMKLQNALRKEGNSPEFQETAEQVLNRFFERVMRKCES
jgi:hypothetical protein